MFICVVQQLYFQDKRASTNISTSATCFILTPILKNIGIINWIKCRLLPHIDLFMDLTFSNFESFIVILHNNQLSL